MRSKNFTTLKKNESTSRHKKLEVLVKDNIDRMFTDSQTHNILVTLVPCGNVDSNNYWDIIMDDLPLVATKILKYKCIQSVLSCVEAHNDIYPRIELIIWILVDYYDSLSDIVTMALSDSQFTRDTSESKRPNILKTTKYGEVLFVLKNSKYSLVFDLIGYPCCLLTRNQTIYDFFRLLSNEVKRIFIDNVSSCQDQNSRISQEVMKSVNDLISYTDEELIESPKSLTNIKDQRLSEALVFIENFMKDNNLVIYTNKIYSHIEDSVCNYRLWRGKNGLSKTPGSIELLRKACSTKNNTSLINSAIATIKSQCTTDDEPQNLLPSVYIDDRIIELSDCMFHIPTCMIFEKTTEISCSRYYDDVSSEEVLNPKIPRNWLGILKNSGQLNVDNLKRFYSLLVSRRHKDGVITLLGESNSGKSTLIAGLLSIFPENRIARANFDGGRFNIPDLTDKYVLVIDDSIDKVTKPVKLLLEGYLGIREGKYRDSEVVDFSNITMIISCNDLEWCNDDESILNRLHIINFTRLRSIDISVRDNILDIEVLYITLWLAGKYNEIKRITNTKIALNKITNWRSRSYKD